MTPRELASRIDHTILKPEAIAVMIDRLCDEAAEYGFAAVCVNPVWVERCVARLSRTGVRVAAVAGFPLGASLPAVKAEEARRAAESGAREIDMVVRLGDLVAGDTGPVIEDIAAVVRAARACGPDRLVKVILETAALNEDQIAAGCRCAVQAGADYVKTSTGFHPAGGATVRAVQLLARHAAGLKVKASGGIRDLASAIAMLDAGADRLGCSAGVQIVRQLIDDARPTG